MLKTLKLALAIASIGFVTTACNRQVTRIDPKETIDISGSWNNSDSRMTAEAMIQQCLGGAWLQNHIEKKGKKPVVIVGFVNNKSHEHIDAETFTKDLERSFVTTARVGLVQGGKKREELRAERADQQTNASQSTMKKFGLETGADYILQGTITSIVDAFKKKKVVEYQVSLELTDLQTNEVVWIGDKKIAKYVKN